MTGPGELLTLRGYQRDCIDAVNAGWARGIRRPAAVLATGLGKTVIFSHLTKEFLLAFPRRRVLILAHTDELIEQAARKVKDVAPHLPVGIVKGTRNDVHPTVIVSSVQTLRRENRRQQLHGIGLIIVDECHHAVAQSYLDILEHFGAFDPESHVRIVGFTATLARSDNKALNTVWEEVVFVRDILFGITNNDNGPCAPGDGYLLDVSGVRVEVPDLDLDAVKRSRGDFQEGDLGRAMTESLAPEVVADAYVENAKDDTGLAFWPTVEAAYIGAEAMNSRGIVTEVVHGTLKKDERRDIFTRLAKGDTQVVSNCMVATEGVDVPRVRVAAVARPTRFKGLYQQIVGRALRPYPGQKKALILDVCGTSKTNDLACLADLSDKPIREVRDGETLANALAREAEEAGIELPPYAGPVVFEEFDPFAKKSKRVWMQTHGGTHFLAWGTNRCLFLVPTTDPNAQPGTWDVAWCAKKGTWMGSDGVARYGGFTEHRGIELGYAMNWAETMANQLGDDDSDFGNKRASWRRREASEKQVTLARSMGIEIAEGATSGDVSTAIDVAFSSQRVDYYVGKILGTVA